MKSISLRLRILLIVSAFAVASQLVYLVVTVRAFQENYYDILESNLQAVGETLKGNLDYVLGLGISIDKLVGLEPLLHDILSDAPQLRAVGIQDAAGDWLYYCDRNGFRDADNIGAAAAEGRLETPSEPLGLTLPLSGKDPKNRLGRLTLWANETSIRGQIQQIAVDSATVILISVLAIIDFLLFVVAYTIAMPVKRAARDIEMAGTQGILDLPVRRTGMDFLDALLEGFDRYRMRVKLQWMRLTVVSQGLFFLTDRAGSFAVQSAREQIGGILNRYRLYDPETMRRLRVTAPVLIRPAVFLFVFAESLSISFLPVYAQELYQPLWGLSPDVVVGLPISVFMFFTAVSLPVGGAWSDRIGRKKVFAVGALIAGIGLLLSGTAPNVLHLIAYRMLVGVGFGLVFMTAQAYVVDTTTAQDRAEGMAMFISAFYGGTLCGSAVGGMLADRLGYRVIFYLGAVLTVVSIGFLYLFISEATRSFSEKRASEDKRLWTSIRGSLPSPRVLVQLLSDRNFVALTFLQSIPNKICLIGFVYYLAPLILKDLGNTPSDTGRIIMTYSFILIVFSQAVSRWSERRGFTEQGVFWGGTLSGAVLILFFLYSGTAMVAAGIAVLGLAHALSVPNQAKLVSQLSVVQSVGIGPGLGMYRQLERVGNVIAPIAAGLLMTRMPFGTALGIIGAYTVASSCLFRLLFRPVTDGEGP